MIALLFALAALAVAFATAVSYSRDWRAALLVPFRPHLAAVSWLVLLATAMVDMPLPLKLILLLAAFGAAVVNLGEVVLRTPRGAGSSGARRLRLVFSNVLRTNADASRLIDWVRREDVDVLVVAESVGEWPERLSLLADKWPYIARTPNGDVAIYSRHPFAGEPHHIMPAIGHAVAVELAGLTLVALHTAAPEDRLTRANCNELIERVGEHVQELAGPVAVVGDFNATPWCAPVIRLLASTGLRFGPGARIGTFPAERYGRRYPTWFVLPIDLVLAANKAAVTARRHGPLVGSDHWPVIAEIAY